jgi:hypothetical protein
MASMDFQKLDETNLKVVVGGKLDVETPKL